MYSDLKNRWSRLNSPKRLALVLFCGLVVLFSVCGLFQPMFEGTLCTSHLFAALAKYKYKIEFQSDNNGDQKFRTYVMNADGSDIQVVEDQNHFERFAYQKWETTSTEYKVWSPDQSKIAMSNSYPQIVIVNADGSGARMIFSPPVYASGIWDFDWSPDEKYIVFTFHDLHGVDDRLNGLDTTKIYIVDVERSIACQLSDNPRQNFKGPVWVNDKQPKLYEK